MTAAAVMRVLCAAGEAEFPAPFLKRPTRRGIEAVGVGSGGEASAATDARLPGEQFDAVVLDAGMPGMGGLAALKKLRVRHPRVPVPILTGRAGMGDAMAGLWSGAWRFLVKPVELDTLFWCLQDTGMEARIPRERSDVAGRPPARGTGGTGRTGRLREGRRIPCVRGGAR